MKNIFLLNNFIIAIRIISLAFHTYSGYCKLDFLFCLSSFVTYFKRNKFGISRHDAWGMSCHRIILLIFKTDTFLGPKGNKQGGVSVVRWYCLAPPMARFSWPHAGKQDAWLWVKNAVKVTLAIYFRTPTFDLDDTNPPLLQPGDTHITTRQVHSASRVSCKTEAYC